MKRQDYCMRGISKDGSVKVWVAETTALSEEARKNHDCWSVGAAALGRLLTATAFFGQNLKGDDDVTVKIDADGPLGSLVAVANAKGELRGYVQNPHVDIPRKANGKLDVGAAVGSGTLSVIKDMGFGDPYVGTIELSTGEIGDDVSKYYLESEQIPSATGLGVQVGPDGTITAAGGFLIQVMPDALPETIAQLELNIANLLPVSGMIAEGWSAEEITHDLMLGVPWKELEYNDLTYKCNCSEERMQRAILSLGRKEVRAILEEQGEAEIVCRFCGQKYHFDRAALEQLADEADQKRYQEIADSLRNAVDIEELARQQAAAKAETEGE